MTISKEQVMAPVGQTTSHSVHQPHSTVSIMLIMLLVFGRYCQEVMAQLIKLSH